MRGAMRLRRALREADLWPGGGAEGLRGQAERPMVACERAVDASELLRLFGRLREVTAGLATVAPRDRRVGRIVDRVHASASLDDLRKLIVPHEMGGPDALP
jgi:hypothetical protein